MKTLGMRIRELREQKDLSLREFARSLKLSAAFISDIELGRRLPSESVLAKMATILETSLEELRSFDTRTPVEDIKRLMNQDPAYGMAFRRVLGEKLTPDELIKLVEDRRKGADRKE